MKDMLTKIRNYIIAGIAVVLPLALSIVILLWMFDLVANFIMRFIPSGLKARPLFSSLITFASPVVALVILAFIGMFAKFIFIRKIFGLGESLLVRIPFFNKIYIAIKQISHAFLSTEQTIFQKVVLIEYPRKGLFSIGFITSKAKGEVQVKTRHEVMNVFVPTTPNPTSGLLVFVDKDSIIELDMPIADGMKLVVSGGAVTPPYNPVV